MTHKRVLRIFIFAPLFLIFANVNAQFTVAYHQSNLPFAAFSYHFNKFYPELRVGMDSSSPYFEVGAGFKAIQKEDYEFYFGIGYGFNGTWLAIPVGLNIYPFENKNFGFQMEVSPLLMDTGVRGSLGIRYRFDKKE